MCGMVALSVCPGFILGTLRSSSQKGSAQRPGASKGPGSVKLLLSEADLSAGTRCALTAQRRIFPDNTTGPLLVSVATIRMCPGDSPFGRCIHLAIGL